MSNNSNNRIIDFSLLTGSGIKVAVVDSGIASAHKDIGPIAGGISLYSDRDGAITQAKHFEDSAGHGTACAGIIRQKASEAELYSVQIFDKMLSASGRVLIAAIEWSIEQNMDVVNLSLGTTDLSFCEELATVCRRALEANVILVSADNNDGHQSYPAIFSNVIGVTGKSLRGRYGYHYRPMAKIECIARGDLQRVCWNHAHHTHTMVSGNSFAAPHITGIVTLIRETHPGASLDDVRKALQVNAANEKSEEFKDIRPLQISVPDSINQSSSFSWIKRAALYPFNKEIHALIRSRDRLNFEIVGIADPVGKGLVGKDAGEVLGIPSIGIRIEPQLSAAVKHADTLILGYVDQLSRIGNKDMLRDCIETALYNGCHVFSLLAIPRETYGDLWNLAAEKNLRLIYPSIETESMDAAFQGHGLYDPVDVPVVGVFGTSSQQGKFTLQLALRHRLLDRGYSVGQIGTEHHAALFGMDLAFPTGYASPLRMPLQWHIPFLDYKVRQICHTRHPDLILVGSQSSTIPYDVREHGAHSITSAAFIMGTKPDACILVVNNIDDDVYIQDTINGIRALAKAPTLLLAMSDKEKHTRTAYGRTFLRPRPLGSEEVSRRLHQLEDRFGLPAIPILSEKGQQQMVDILINYFAAEDLACQSS